MPHKILIVDDDTELCAMVADYLELEGFSSEAIHDGESGASTACSGSFDAIVLDVMLPRMNGFDALRQIRSQCDTPVLMLTARGEDIDRIVGLELGADDYLPKPFNPRELIARLKAILRRAPSNGEPDLSELTFGPLTLLAAARKVTLKEETLELTSSEFNILECLLQAPGTVVTKETLSEQALGKTLARYDRSIDMHISHLRRKLASVSADAPQIQTIRGIGYQLTLDS